MKFSFGRFTRQLVKSDIVRQICVAGKAYGDGDRMYALGFIKCKLTALYYVL